MFKKAFLWTVSVAALLLLLVYYFGATDGSYSVTVNGEEVHALPGVAVAAGGLLAAGLAVAGILALAALVLAGASMVLLWVMAVFFLGVLFVFSPVWAPVAAVVIVLAFVFRTRKGKNPANERRW